MKTRVTIFHPGTQHAPQLGREIERLGILQKYITSIGFTKKSLINSFFQKIPSINKKLIARTLDKIPNKRIKIFPIPELKFLIKQQLNKNLIIKDAINQRNKELQNLIKDNDIEKCDVVIGYDTSSWILAQRVKEKGKKFVLDQTTCHSATKQKYIDFLRARYPEWYDQVTEKKDEQLINQEKIEHDLADLIVVPSHFVKNSLVDNGVDAGKIIINSYGTSRAVFNDFGNRDYNSEILIFLFVGAVNANKGIPDLIKVWIDMKIKSAELWIVGHENIDKNQINYLKKYGIKILGKIPKNLLPNIYNKAHIFIFPSYFEGLAQVQIEALCCGLPIIGTYNSGASELITQYENGILINAGDTTELETAIEWFLQHKNQLPSMSEKARLSSVSLTWEAYGNRWMKIIDSLIN